MESVKLFLERKLKLKVNEEKSQVDKTDKTDFLGFTFKGNKIRWSDNAFREFKRKVKWLTGRSWFVSMEYRYKKLAQYLRGWMNYFGLLIIDVHILFILKQPMKSSRILLKSTFP